MANRISNSPGIRPVTAPTVDRTPSTPAAPKPAAAPASTFSTGPVRTGNSPQLTGTSTGRAAEMAAEIQKLMEGHTDRAEEGRILDIFRSANPQELNSLVARLDIHELTEDMDDRLFGPDNRKAFLKLLTQDRAGDLTVGSKVKFITALQVGDTDGQEERAIRDMFLSTKGKELTQLKNGIDAGDYHDLQELVFRDIDSSSVRKSILDHIAKEAVPSGEVKVLSDIDDTFYENLKDHRFPPKTVYPGVIEFYDELDKGPGGNSPEGDLAFVTARPNDRAGLVETLTKKMLKDKGVDNATVLEGDLLSNLSNDKIAAKKFENYSQYKQLYPEYGFVFTGDSGQGDAIFGAKMQAETPGAVKAVFINDVRDTPAAERADWAAKGVNFVDTYVGAAVKAYDMGLIGKDGLKRVADGAEADFGKINFTDTAQRDARRAELDRDLADARARLG